MLESEKNYLYSLHSRESMRLYYAVKERFGEKLPDRKSFIQQVVESITPHFEKYETIIIPESSNTFIQEVAKGLNKKIVVVKKNNKESILKYIESLALQKKEKQAHIERLSEMKTSVKINELKANQRRKYTSILFEKTFIINTDTAIILDDSCFSETTKKALIESTNVKNAFFIFKK